MPPISSLGHHLPLPNHTKRGGIDQKPDLFRRESNSSTFFFETSWLTLTVSAPASDVLRTSFFTSIPVPSVRSSRRTTDCSPQLGISVSRYTPRPVTAVGGIKGFSSIARNKQAITGAKPGSLTPNTRVGKYCGDSSGGMKLPAQLVVCASQFEAGN